VYQQRVNAIYSGRGDNKINREYPKEIIISLNDVSFGFKQQYSYLLYLDNILYKIRKGFVLGIIGSNGAGRIRTFSSESIMIILYSYILNKIIIIIIIIFQLDLIQQCLNEIIMPIFPLHCKKHGLE
jgi:hypothetical protein